VEGAVWKVARARRRTGGIKRTHVLAAAPESPSWSLWMSRHQAPWGMLPCCHAVLLGGRRRDRAAGGWRGRGGRARGAHVDARRPGAGAGGQRRARAHAGSSAAGRARALCGRRPVAAPGCGAVPHPTLTRTNTAPRPGAGVLARARGSYLLTACARGRENAPLSSDFERLACRGARHAAASGTRVEGCPTRAGDLLHRLQVPLPIPGRAGHRDHGCGVRHACKHQPLVANIYLAQDKESAASADQRLF